MLVVREMSEPDGAPLIRVRSLRKEFPNKVGGTTIAVNNVSFDVMPNETFGLVGPSSSGKSTIGRMILGLLQPSAGDVLFEGVSLSRMDARELRETRRHMQIVFQNPLASLNPSKTVGASIELPMINFQLGNSSERKERTAQLLRLVGLEPKHAERYPHEFSGGQAQRIGIARALASNAKFLFLDEPVSALDVSIQAQILNLLKELQEKLRLTYLFVGNNLNVVQHVSDRIAIVKDGEIIEMSSSGDLFKSPRHEYTKSLMSAVLSLSHRRE